MKIALFGGSFDPPTLAHEAIIASCLHMADFDELWIMPSGAREDKPEMSSDAARLELLTAMKQRVFGDDPRLIVTEFEMGLPRPTQTIATVQALRQAYPDHEFWFVFGADSYHAMPSWRDGKQLQGTLPILLVERFGYRYPAVPVTVRRVPLPPEVVCKRASSTEVRHAVKTGQTIDHLVSQAVLDSIFRLGLYRAVQ